VNVYDVPLVVCVVVSGDVTIEYDVAPEAAVHVRSPVVAVLLTASRFVTGPGAVVIDADVAEPPGVNIFTDVTVNV
jgi:hypothetical protein